MTDNHAAGVRRPIHRGPYHVWIVPHSHIDVEWYWTFDITRVFARTVFRDALALLERDDREAFAQDQVPLVELFVAEAGGPASPMLRRLIDDGRFEAIGGSYIQPEVAEPHGECLVRQFLLGNRRWRELVGAPAEVAWFIDTFGQVPQIAQILSGVGINAFVFERGVPGRVGEPPGTFLYQSPDGSRVLTYWMSSGYGNTAESLERALLSEIDHATTPVLMIPWGSDVSNPASMPATEAARCIGEIAARNRMPLAAVTIGTPGRFFRALREHARDVPVVAEDFAPPHDRFADLRGTYSNRAPLKIANRGAENALLAAEAWAALAATLGAPYPGDALAVAWERILFTHFHDVIGGSCTDAVFLAAMRRLEAVRATADEVADRALDLLARRIDTTGEGYPVAVFNPTSAARTDVAMLDMVFRDPISAFRVVNESGRVVPHEVREPRGGRHLSTARAVWLASDVPAFGWRLYRFEPIERRAPGVKTGVGQEIENEFFRVVVDRHSGDVTGIIDRRTGWNYLRGHGNEIVARREENPSMEGMVHLTGAEERTSALNGVRVETEVAKFASRVRTTAEFLGCRLIREVELVAGLPRVIFRTTFENFHGGDVLVSVSFPAALSDMVRRYVYETPYAMTERSEEEYHCAQTVVDLTDELRGIALVNTGSAGYWPRGNAIELVLFRSVADFPDYHSPLAAEHGTHTYEYALIPHEGDWRDGGVIAAAHAVNRPLRALPIDRHEGPWPARLALLSAIPENVEVSAIKRAESDEAMVVRVVETAGTATQTTVTFGFPVRSVRRATLGEERKEELGIDDGSVRLRLRGFEIATLIVDPA